jgi:L-2-hydroxyglutarate oxidase LhgO
MDYDAIVVGGGIVGLAIARREALCGRSVAVLEAELGLCHHASSRNSEVVHAGLYYAPGSLKATACLRGRRALLEYCAARGVRVSTPGKLVVACDAAEHAALAALAANAASNGVALEWIDAVDVARMEPSVVATAALHSPGTAIVDSHGLASTIEGEIRDAGGDIVLGCRFLGARPSADGLVVAAGDTTVTSRRLYLAAGARAPALAATIEGFDPTAAPAAAFAKGQYFRLVGGPRFTRLVYPVPVPGGLGIHVTIDLDGGVRLGPDVQWVDDLDYDVDASHAAAFAAAVQRYAPAVRAEDLTPAYAGVRAKIVGPGQPSADFCVRGPTDHGVVGVVALFGIESPGLTAAFALADEAVARADAASS